MFEKDPSAKPSGRVWAQDVKVGVQALDARLATIRARQSTLPPADEAVWSGVQGLLEQADAAASGRNPRPLRFRSWWRGTLIEAAYQNLHAAESEIVALYNECELEAEFPEAIGRVEASLNRDDPRRTYAKTAGTGTLERQRAQLRKLIEVGHGAIDHQHSRLRSFRNVVLMTALLIGFLVVLFIIFVTTYPEVLPLCFEPSAAGEQICPAGADAPSAADVKVIALLGLLGGALAAAVSIRNMKGTSTPYDIPVALALLKVTAGSLTAIGAIIAIRGQFVPGLSDLDSQGQILAYALVFGYAQQLLTGLIDRRAQSLLDSVPSKDGDADRPLYDPPTP